MKNFQHKKGPADYALFVNGKLLGIVEAKRKEIDPQNVLEQAKRYSRGCNITIGLWGEYRVPFLYSSNGKIIWFADVREANYYSREISQFHTPQALEEMFNKDMKSAKSWLANTPINFEKLRPYQRDAIAAIEKALIENKHRVMIAIATGTGKTFTIVSLIYRLLKSGFARRILFLVDRRALAAQAT